MSKDDGKTFGEGDKAMLDMFNQEDRQILAVIEELRGMGGEAYGEVGHRNPVRGDTAPLLTVLTKVQKPKRILELGTAYGFSGLHLLLGNKEATLDTVEFDAQVANEAQANFNEAGVKAQVHAGDAGAILDQLQGEYDLVFIDHNKKDYLSHFYKVRPHMHQGSILVADNVNDRRSECGDFVSYMQATNPTTQIIPTECGLLVATI